MSTPTNHFKLGLFVVIGIAVTVGSTIFVGVRSSRKETVSYHTYFNESVQGLELGSPVKYRGVTIGHVASVEIAPDHRHVDVSNEIDVEDIRRLGLVDTGAKNKETRFLVPPELRAQLGSQGITGVKFILIDFFDVKSNPPPVLPFPVADNTIPTAVSVMKNLEDSVVRAVDTLPELAASILAVTTKIDIVVADIQQAKIGDHANVTLANADDMLKTLRGFIQNAQKSELPAKAAKTVENLDGAVTKLSGMIDNLQGKDGLFVSAKRATDAFGDVGKSAHGTTRELEDTLREVRETSSSIKSLAEALERDPDMLIKGRAKAKSR